MYELLIDYGMPVMAEDIAYAVHVLPNSKHELMKLLVSKCEDCGDAAFEKAVDTAVKGNKKQFVTALKGGTKVSFIINYRIVGNFRRRKLSRTSWFEGYQRMFSP